MQLEKVLKQYFNYETFRSGQKEVISSVLEGNHTVAMLPTGTGKSLCYQLPGYLINGSVVVVSPLLSLMQDQVEQMKMRGEKRVIALNSFLTPNEKRNALKNLNKFKYIFVSPEILSSQLIMDHLKKLSIALFVIDEAHCISQWGYDFRPDYQRLGKVREQLGFPLTLALTATATEEVKQDIIHSLELLNWKEYIFSVDRPNIAISSEHFQSQTEKIERLVDLAGTLKGPGIIYFSSKKISEQVAERLRKKGIGRVMAYHGGLEHESRILIQQQFLHGQLDIICATSAFGMGINKEDIRFIIHFHMPMQIESFLQEIGRAGRDGQNSVSILLYSQGDEQLAYQLAEGEIPSLTQLDFLFDLIEKNKLNWNDKEEWGRVQTLCGFSEIQLRMVEDYLKEVPSNANLLREKAHFKQLIEERITVKRRKISQMVKLVQLNGCKREFLLNYFNEEQKIKVDNCCVFCGIDYERFRNDRLVFERENEQFDWQRQLAELLLNKSERENEKQALRIN